MEKLCFQPERFRGVIVALNACYDKAGEVSPAACRALCRWYQSLGVRGVYVGGSTGEGLLLSLEERKTLGRSRRAGGAGGDDGHRPCGLSRHPGRRRPCPARRRHRGGRYIRRAQCVLPPERGEHRPPLDGHRRRGGAALFHLQHPPAHRLRFVHGAVPPDAGPSPCQGD